MDFFGTDGASSSSESSVDRTRPRFSKRRVIGKKKPKTTYYARKDEIQQLQAQVKRLEEQIAKVERERASPEPVSMDTLLVSAILSNAVKHSKLTVAGTQSMLSAYSLATIQAKGSVPLSHYIHLPADHEARRSVLASLNEPKLLAVSQFMNERTRYLDLRVAQKQVEQFELPNGDAGVIATDVIQFDSGHSLRQVYDALMFSSRHPEFTVTDHLGVLTIRESEEFEEFQFSQTRFLSAVAGGVEIESNLAIFTTCVDATDETTAFMIGALDFVDQDDLFPYRPELCVRKEVTGAVTMHELLSLTGGPPTIAMTRWSYSRMLAPQFPLSKEFQAAGLASMLEWCEMIPKTMKELLATIVPANAA